MMKRLFSLLIVLCTVTSIAATHVAVLETVSEKGVIGRSEKTFLTDKIRERAKAVLPAYMGYVIMTRENINAMLPPGKSIEDCEGSCLVETGKNIAADYVAQARVGKFGKQFTLTMELYETAGNNLVGTFTARKHDAEGLLDEIEKETDKVFKLILGNVPLVDNGESLNGKKEEELESNLVDSRDGKSYRTVRIGKRTWMAENLNFKLNKAWNASSAETINNWCYNNDESNCPKYGRLYTWNAAMKACPIGWHLPSKIDFESLFDAVEGVDIAGNRLKSKNGWHDWVDRKGEQFKGNGIDSYNFTALPAGSFHNGRFYYLGDNAYFWSSTEYDASNAYRMNLYNDNDGGNLSFNRKYTAFSVRCVKD